MTRKKKKLQSQTLPEFKAWLSGVEEMQPEDWVPDLSQWQLIRERISKIKEVEKTVEHNQQDTTETPYVHPPMPNVQIPRTSTAFDEVKFMDNPPPAPQPAVNQTGEVVERTPDIDSSSGYVSSFT